MKAFGIGCFVDENLALDYGSKLSFTDVMT